MATSDPPPVRYATGQRLWLRDPGQVLPRLEVVVEPQSPSPRGDRVVWGVEFEGHHWRSVDADGHLRNVEVQDPEPLRLLGWQKTTRNRSGSGATSQWHGRVSDGRHLTVVRAGDGWGFLVFDDGVIDAIHESEPVKTVQQARKAATEWALANPAEVTG